MNAILAALVNGAVAGAAAAAAIWCVLRLVPRRVLNASTRYAVWWAALAIVLLLPALYLPRPVRPARPAEPAPPGPPAAAMVNTPAMPAIRQAGRPARPAALPRKTEAPPPAILPVVVLRHPHRWEWLYGCLLAAWALASTALLARLLLSWVLLARIRRRAYDPPARFAARTEHWFALLRSGRRGVRLAASDELAIPMAAGPRHPTILIPARLLHELPEEDLDQLGLHEAAHLARRDDYALIVQRAIEAVFALHPVVRWIARQIDLEREAACDALVIGATGQARSYAACLTRVVELSGAVRPSLAAAGAAENGSHLARRVEMLLDKTRHTGTKLLKGRLAALVSVLAALVWIAGKTPGLVAFATPIAHSAARALVAPLAQTPLLPQAAVPPQDVDGRVVEDASGNPLPSAELRVHKAGWRELAADLGTDRQGRFRASGLPPGEYIVDVSKANYITSTFKLKVPAAGQVVRLVRYAVIDGRVTNTAGEPLPGRVLASYGQTIGGTRITVLVRAPGTGQFHVFREAALDNAGHYRIFDLPPGQYALGLWYSGVQDGSGMQLYPDTGNPRWFTISGGEEYDDVNFVVTPRAAYSVSGKIELPKPDQQFQLALGLPEQPALPVGMTLTERDGSFRFEKVPAGSYDLFVSGPTGGYGGFESILSRNAEPLFGRTRVQVIAQDVAGITVPLSPGRKIGVVLRARGSGAPPAACPKTATVSLVPQEPWAMSFGARVQTGFEKEQAVGDLAPGRFRVSATDLGAGCYQVNQPVVDLQSETAGPVAVEVAAAGSIRGVLKTGAARPADFAVVLLDTGSAASGAEAKLAFADAEGRFAFDGLKPGRYRIAARPAAGAASARWVADVNRTVEIEVAGGSTTQVELPVDTKGAAQ